jgi:hypothetical protein
LQPSRFCPPCAKKYIHHAEAGHFRRAVAYREGAFTRLLAISSDHDATYGKK